MKLTDAIKTQIDGMSYEDVLRRWRFSPPGDLFFQGATRKYCADRMAELYAADPAAARSADKRVGWLADR